MPTKPNAGKTSFEMMRTDVEGQSNLHKAYAAFIKKLLEEKKITEGEALSFLSEAKEKKLFTFQSPAEATRFFTEQAKAGEKFMVREVVDGKSTGMYKFSDGSGNLVEGTLSPETMDNLAKAWKDIHAQPEVIAALKKNDEVELQKILQAHTAQKEGISVGTAPTPRAGGIPVTPMSPVGDSAPPDETTPRPNI